MTTIDLAPFGFTPTESLAYGALLDRGPSSGYALAKFLNMARANVYQALNGLVSKGAAVAGDETPQVFRAVAPEGILAQVVAGEARKLDRLERQIEARGGEGAPATVGITSQRQLRELVLRSAVRAKAPVTFVAPTELLGGLLPIWRKRAADDAPTILWAVGEAPADFPLPLAGTLAPGRVHELFGTDVAIALAGGAVIVVRLAAEGISGYWSQDPALVGTARATVASLVGSA